MNMRGILAVAAVTIMGVFLATPATSVAESCLADENLPGNLPCFASTGESYDGFVLGTDSPDGNDTEEAVEAVLGYVVGSPVDISEVLKVDPPGNQIIGEFTITDSSSSGFEWEYSGSLTLAYLTVKAGEGFAVFDINGLTEGTVDLTGLTTSGVSHFTFWSGPVTQVPEPNTLVLLGTGLVLAAAAWRRRRSA